LSIYWFGIGYLWNSLAGLVLPPLVQRLVAPGTKNTWLGLLEWMGLLLAAVIQPTFGAVSDGSPSRFGRRRPFIVVGSVAVLACLAGLATAGSLATLMLFYVLLQVASNIAQGPYQGMIPDLVESSQRTQASAFMGASNLLGTLAGFVVIGLIIMPRQHYRAIATMGAVVAVTALLTLAMVPDRRLPRPGLPFAQRLREGLPTPPRLRLAIREYPDFFWLLVSRFLFWMGLVGIQSFAYFFLQDAFHLRHPRKETATVLIGIVGLAIVVTLVSGPLVARFGKKRLVALSCALAAGAAAMLAVSPTLQWVYACAALLGVAGGLFVAVDWAFATDLVPKAEAGRYMGFANIATAGSAGAARLVGGPLIDSINHFFPALGYRVLYVAAAAAFGGSILALRPVREIEVA
jgi:Na+/melibiose symporter-like transporter